MKPILKMGSGETRDDGQAAVWNCIYGYVNGLALNCVVQLGIPDIINTHGSPLSLSSIVKTINHPSLNVDRLSRIMTLLVRRGIFTAIPTAASTEGEDSSSTTTTLYCLTNSSKWLLQESNMSVTPILLLQNHTAVRSSWDHLIDIVKEGYGSGFAKCHGLEFWDYASANPDISNLFNDAMTGASNIIVETVKRSYKDGFDAIQGTLVDAGGGSGAVMGEIMKAYPHIKAINFELLHVVATAPDYAGVTHVAGDMFTGIPPADAILLKWILHTWNDEDCIKILKNCQKALCGRNGGKVIIIEAVLCTEGDDLFDDMRFIFDVVMMNYVQGKDRNEVEWKKLLDEGGFSSYNIIKIPVLLSLIEVFPKV